MAGAGYRTWAANEVVTAANVQTYLQDQVCLVFADTTARDAVTASEGMICYLKSIDQVQTYNGAAWVSVTSVLTGDVLTEDATNDRVGINETSPSAALHVEVKAATTDQLVRLYARTGAEHDADLSFALDNGTGETFTIGIDDSDSDAFKISDGTALGTNDRMVIATSGAMTVAGGITTNVTGNASGSSGSCTGNSATATSAATLTTARNIGGVSFNGSAAITPAEITVADTTDTSCSVALFESATGDLAPKSDGGLTYNAGTGTLTATAFAGPLTGNVTGNCSGSAGTATGNAATATALATARDIGGVSFDGTGNITLPGVNSSGNQNTSGSAATLTTARNIGGVSFDGSAAIVPATITVADTTDTSCSVGLWESATGDLGPKSDGGLTYNAGTGTLTATAFAGPLTGNVTGNTSGSAGSATGNAATATALETARNIGGVSFDGTAAIVPATITVADTTDTTCSVGLWESATGDLGPKSDGGLTYNAGTGMLTATGLTGPLTGNASGSSGSCTGNAATATVAAGLTGGFTEGSLILANQVFS